MADRAHLEREIAAGNAMVQAGNIDAAIRHAKAALDIAPDHIDTYCLQVDILSAKRRPEEALRITQARLERVPDCRWGHLQWIGLLAQMQRAGLAAKARDTTIALFADDPMMVHDAHFMFDATLERDRAVLKRIRQVRETGYWGVFKLHVLEQAARANSGHIHTLGKLQQQDLEDGFVDADTLHSQAKVRYLQGRLLSAAQLARQAMDVDPANRPLYAETLFSARLGLVPLMWPAQAFITLTGSLTARFPWYIRMFTNYAFALLCLSLLGMLSAGVFLIPGVPEAVSGPIISAMFIANVGWALYVIWAWGSVGRMRAKRRQVGLSKDY